MRLSGQACDSNLTGVVIQMPCWLCFSPYRDSNLLVSPAATADELVHCTQIQFEESFCLPIHIACGMAFSVSG